MTVESSAAKNNPPASESDSDDYTPDNLEELIREGKWKPKSSAKKSEEQ